MAWKKINKPSRVMVLCLSAIFAAGSVANSETIAGALSRAYDNNPDLAAPAQVCARPMKVLRLQNLVIVQLFQALLLALLRISTEIRQIA